MLLVRNDVEPTIGNCQGYCLAHIIKTIPQLAARRANAADLLVGGPFTSAIVHNSEEYTRSYLKTYPFACEERNSLRQTPLHIAIIFGNIFAVEAILSLAGNGIVDVPDSFNLYPIDYAVRLAGHECSEPNPKTPKECRRCNILEMMLKSESAIYPQTVQGAIGMPSGGCGILPQMAQIRFLKHLKDRRMRLADIAREFIPEIMISNDCVKRGYVLDRTACNIQQQLQARSILVPNSLKVLRQRGESFATAEGAGLNKTVQDYIFCEAMAEEAWKLGFKDLDPVFSTGLRTLTSLAGRRTIKDAMIMSSHFRWLIDHGVDVTSTFIPATCRDRLLPEYAHSNGITWAHRFMFCLGYCIASDPETAMPTSPRTVSDAIFSQSLSDSCYCFCSMGEGCKPLNKLIMSQCPLESDYGRPHYVMGLGRGRDLGQRILGLIPRSKGWLPEHNGIHRTILRHFTFSALGIRHTCCRFGGRNPTIILSADDVQEINEEQQEDLRMFEDLVTEFEEGCGSIEDLLPFLEGAWVPRMTEVKTSLKSRKLELAELRAAEGLGITWDSEFESSEESSDSDSDSDFDPFGFWMKKLDTIAPEADISLPPDLL